MVTPLNPVSSATVQAQPDVFISYARENKDFVLRLHAALVKAGREVWVDWEDIPLSADWLKEVKHGIDSADTFIFVISPESVQSAACTQEVLYAVDKGKRIIPLLRDKPDTDDMLKLHPTIAAHNWIFFNDDAEFEQTFFKFNQTLDLDLDYVRAHTRLLLRAQDWSDSGGKNSLLLRDDDLRDAEEWLAHTGVRRPLPTDYQRQYINTSRRAANTLRRQWWLITVFCFLMAIMTILAVYYSIDAYEKNQIARENLQIAELAQSAAEAERDLSLANAQLAENLSLAANSIVALFDGNRDLALSLAVKANSHAMTIETERSLASAAYAPGTIALMGDETWPHVTYPTVVRFSGDGTLAVSASCATLDTTSRCMLGDMIVWDVVSRNRLRHLQGHRGQVWDVLFSQDQQYLISGGADGVVIVWDLITGRIVRSWANHTEGIYALALSPDGRWVASGAQDNTIYLHDLTGEIPSRVFTGHQGDVMAVAFSPDGSQLASGSQDQTYIQWNISDGSIVRIVKAHTDSVNALIYNPGGQYILTGSSDYRIRLWQADTGNLVRTYGQGSQGHTDWVSSLAFYSDGNRFLSGSFDNSIMLWDIQRGVPLNRFLTPLSQVASIALHPDERHLLSAQTSGEIRLWDLQDGALLRQIDIQAAPGNAGAVFRDAAYLYIRQTTGAVIIVDAQSGRLVRRVYPVIVGRDGGSQQGVVRSFSLSHQRNMAVSLLEDQRIVLWNPDTGHVIRILDTPGEPIQRSTLVISEDGERVTVATTDQHLLVWNTDTGSFVKFTHSIHSENILSTAISSDHRWIASGGRDNQIVIWNADTGQMLHTLQAHDDYVSALVFSSDNRFLLSASWDNTIKLWEVDTGKLIRLFIGHTGTVSDIAFSPDGKQIISGSYGGTVRVWDIERGLEIRRFSGTLDLVQSVGFSENGRLAFSIDSGGILYIWHIHSRDELLQWVTSHRYIRPLSCRERYIYSIPPGCPLAQSID